MSGQMVTWSIQGTVPVGVIIGSTTGMVTVSNKAVAGGFIVVATDGNVGASKTVTLVLPQNAIITPTVATFDENTEGSTYADIPVTMTLNGSTLTDIQNGNTILKEGTDYVVSGNVVTIQKSYLVTQPVGTITLTFDFSGGNSVSLTITVENTSAPTDTGLNPANGMTAGGTLVTITGTGFTGATVVDFGSTPAEYFAVNSSRSITAPAATAGSADVTVTTPYGTSTKSSDDQFTYVTMPAPDLNNASIGPGSVGDSTEVTAMVASGDKLTYTFTSQSIATPIISEKVLNGTEYISSENI